MVALVNAFKPDCISLAKVNDNSKQTYVDKAFNIAKKDLNIPRVMGPRQMCEKPEATVIRTYIQKFKDLDDGNGFKDDLSSISAQNQGTGQSASSAGAGLDLKDEGACPSDLNMYRAESRKMVDFRDRELGCIEGGKPCKRLGADTVRARSHFLEIKLLFE